MNKGPSSSVSEQKQLIEVFCAFLLFVQHPLVLDDGAVLMGYVQKDLEDSLRLLLSFCTVSIKCHSVVYFRLTFTIEKFGC